MYNVIENPIPSSNLFKTMSLGEISEMIDQMPKAERASAYLVMMMTMNACHQIVEDEILNKEVFAS